MNEFKVVVEMLAKLTLRQQSEAKSNWLRQVSLIIKKIVTYVLKKSLNNLNVPSEDNLCSKTDLSLQFQTADTSHHI